MNKEQEEYLIARMGQEDFDRTVKWYSYSLPGMATRFDHEAQLVEKVQMSGSHFFSADTTKFFGTRLNELYGERFLVMSDKHPSYGRIYRVAYFYQYESARLQAQRIGTPDDQWTLPRARKEAQRLSLLFP